MDRGAWRAGVYRYPKELDGPVTKQFQERFRAEPGGQGAFCEYMGDAGEFSMEGRGFRRGPAEVQEDLIAEDIQQYSWSKKITLGHMFSGD